MDLHPDFYMEYGVGPIAFDMSTAILRMYTPTGFVIVADGRSTDKSMKPYGDGDATQKIFDISGGSHIIASPFTGAVHILSGSKEIGL